jgi:hypothetical protein
MADLVAAQALPSFRTWRSRVGCRADIHRGGVPARDPHVVPAPQDLVARQRERCTGSIVARSCRHHARNSCHGSRIASGDWKSSNTILDFQHQPWMGLNRRSGMEAKGVFSEAEAGRSRDRQKVLWWIDLFKTLEGLPFEQG